MLVMLERSSTWRVTSGRRIDKAVAQAVSSPTSVYSLSGNGGVSDRSTLRADNPALRQRAEAILTVLLMFSTQAHLPVIFTTYSLRALSAAAKVRHASGSNNTNDLFTVTNAEEYHPAMAGGDVPNR
jgi:hypothetical protein